MSTDEGLDVVLNSIGCGLWQIPVLVLSIAIMTAVPMHSLGSPLLSAPMAFKCSYTRNSSLLSLQTHNASVTYATDGQNTTEPFYDSKCLEPVSHTLPNEMEYHEELGHSTGLPSCPWVLYDNSVFTSTVISQFDLICEREMLRPLFQMMYSVGAILGGFIGGQISDSFGRKRAVQIASFVNLAGVISLYFSPNYAATLVSRAIVGGTCNFMILPVFSLALEITPSKHRTVAGMLLGIPFSVGIMLMAGTGYFIRAWKRLLILMATVPFIFIIPLIFTINESPRWLIQKNKASEAATMMARAAKVNSVDIREPFAEAIEKLEKKSNSFKRNEEEEGTRRCLWPSIATTCNGASTYFKSVALRIILIISPIVWILQGCLYLGVMLNANNFTSNDPFIYVAVYGAMDMTSILLATPLSMKIGRRILIAGLLFVGGILFVIDLAVPETLHWLKFVLIMTALNLVAASFQINFLYAPELYPTMLRTRGLALSNFACNIGFMAAPLVVDLLAPLAWWSVGVTFGCGGILASFLVPFLPETLKKPLPETVSDVDRRHENAHYWIDVRRKKDRITEITTEVKHEE